jgi:hypothetical protein
LSVYRLSRQAKSDMTEILARSLKKFGAMARDRYTPLLPQPTGWWTFWRSCRTRFLGNWHLPGCAAEARDPPR